VNGLDTPKKLLSSIEDIERFVDRYSLGRDRGEGSKHFLRIKIPNGMLTADQFRRIAHLAEKYGRGYAEITDRQDIQLHWIEPEDAMSLFTQLEEIGFTTDKCGQGYPGARYGDVRNIVGCPVAGVDKFELIDTSPIVKQLNEFFTGNKDFLDLPRKFKISVSGCSINCTNPEVNDLSFVALRKLTGEVGFVALVGGTVGVAPKLAQPLGVFIEPDDVVDVTKAIVEVYRDYGSREIKVKARFRWLVEEWGIEKLRRIIEEKIEKTLEAHNLDYLPTSGGEHIGVQPQRQEGYTYISIPIVGGMLSRDKMLNIAEVAEKYASGDLRLSPSQNIIIINIPREHVNSVIDKLERIGFSMKGSLLKWTTIACAGNFCGKSPDHPKKRAVEIVDYLEKRFGETLRNSSLRIHISGCPNGCGRHLTADIGLQAVQLTVEGRPKQGYNIYLGGGLGPKASLGRLTERGVGTEDVKYTIENLLLAYAKEETNFRSFREFCDRHTVEELKFLMNPSPKSEE